MNIGADRLGRASSRCRLILIARQLMLRDAYDAAARVTAGCGYATHEQRCRLIQISKRRQTLAAYRPPGLLRYVGRATGYARRRRVDGHVTAD